MLNTSFTRTPTKSDPSPEYRIIDLRISQHPKVVVEYQTGETESGEFVPVRSYTLSLRGDNAQGFIDAVSAHLVSLLGEMKVAIEQEDSAYRKNDVIMPQRKAPVRGQREDVINDESDSGSLDTGK